VNGEKDVALVPETLYYEPAGSTFRIRNTGDGPLQVLITLVRVEPAASSSQSPTPAGARQSQTEDQLGPSPL